MATTPDEDVDSSLELWEEYQMPTYIPLSSAMNVHPLSWKFAGVSHMLPLSVTLPLSNRLRFHGHGPDRYP